MYISYIYIYMYILWCIKYTKAMLTQWFNIPKTWSKACRNPPEILGVADDVAAAGHVDGHGPWEYPLRSPREQRPHRDAWGDLGPWVEWFHRLYLWWFIGDIMEYIYICIYICIHVFIYIYIWYMIYIYIYDIWYIYIHKQETWLWGWLKWDTPRSYGIVW